MVAFKHAAGEHAGLVEVVGRIVMDTGKAILLEGEGKREWLPKSKVIVEALPDGRVAVLMKGWLASLRGYV